MITRGQIKYLFSNPIEAMRDGLWFSGEEGEGEFKLWWNNGNIRMHYFCKDGKEDGEYKNWSSNGKLRTHCKYSEGELVKDYLNDI